MRNIFFLLAVLPTFASAGAPGAESGWQLETIDDPSGNGSLATLRQDSATTIKDESAANDVTPRLEFRCTPGDAAVTARIDWQRFISSFSTEVGFKVDGGRFTWLKWKLDSTEQVTLSPSAADTQKLIDTLSGASMLLVEVSPYSQGPENAEFDLTGFAGSLASLINECR
jgi:hypothetical protein